MIQLRSIFLFVSLLYLSEPNKTRLITTFSLNFFIAESMSQMLLRSSHISIWSKRQHKKKKFWVDSLYNPPPHIGFIQSLKFCLNLCSFKWLKLSLSRESNFKPFEWWIENKNRSLCFIKVFLNFLICFVKLWMNEWFVKLLNLLHLEMQNEFSNFSVLVLKVFNVISKIFLRVLFHYFHYFTNPSSINDRFQISYLCF